MNKQLPHSLLAHIADSFWEKAGGRPKPPVDLLKAISLVLPLDVIALSKLSLKKVESKLINYGINYSFFEEDRLLFGLLVVYRGKGFIFLDASDSQSERHYTLAHEVAHFLLDYQRPRQQAAEKIGPQILEVLDGQRLPSFEEEVKGVLAEVSVSSYIHILSREENSFRQELNVVQSENQADILACELLAPTHEIEAQLHKTGNTKNYYSCVIDARNILLDKYNIPNPVSDLYARRIAQKLTGGSSLISSLMSE